MHFAFCDQRLAGDNLWETIFCLRSRDCGTDSSWFPLAEKRISLCLCVSVVNSCFCEWMDVAFGKAYRADEIFQFMNAPQPLNGMGIAAENEFAAGLFCQ